MKIKILGAHNCESAHSKMVSLIIDGFMAIDAGSLTSSLSAEAQLELKAIFLTHQHYDHVRDVPAIGMNLSLRGASTSLYCPQQVRDILATHLLDGELYPKFLERPPSNPTLKYVATEPYKPLKIEGYRVTAVPVSHAVPAVGYEIVSPEGKAVFYTGDTGAGLAASWEHVSPQLLIIEVTAPNKFDDGARATGHLTPRLLRQELISFRELKGYLPSVVVVHMNPFWEKEIEAEIALLAAELGGSIKLGYEGMEIVV